jgi:hypothetical protein
VRFRSFLCGALLLAALAGCAPSNGGGPADPADPAGAATATATAWAEPANYSYVLEASCGERALIGRFRVTVTNAQVSRTEGLDPAARRASMLRLADLVPTLGRLLDQAETARRNGAAKVEVQTDPADGHPTSIQIDEVADAVDDEECYAISDYTIEVKPASSGVPSR